MNLSLHVLDFEGEVRLEMERREEGEVRLAMERKDDGDEPKVSRRSEVPDIPAGRLRPDFLV